MILAVLVQAEVADRAAERMRQIEERPWHQRAGRKGLDRLNSGLGRNETISLRPVKDVLVVEWKATRDSIVVAEEGEQARGLQLFGSRQAARLGAIDLTYKKQRLLLGHRPFPTRRRQWRSAKAGRRCRDLGAPLRLQPDGGQR